MKKSAFSILVLAGLFLFFGCNNIIEDKTDVAESEKTAEAAETSLANKAEACIRFAKPVVKRESRTVLPGFNDNSLNFFAFSLKGGLTTSTVQEVLGSYESMEKLSAASLTCAEGLWNFTLTASKDGTVFTGSLQNISITSGDNRLSFELAWDKTALEGQGSLEFNLDYGLAQNAGDVKLVTAELLKYDVATASETALADYAERQLVPLNNAVTFETGELDAGNYRVKIYLYADNEKQHLINTWRELAIVTGGQKSLANRTFEKLNKVYKITYELNSGNESETAPLPKCFTRHSGDVVLTAPERNGFSFSGWYSSPDFNGDKVEKIDAGNLGDKTFYARWAKAAITITIQELNDLNVTYVINGLSVVFTAENGSSPYIWKADGETQSTTAATFTFDTSNLPEGLYEIEAVSGDLSSMATVAVNGADSYIYVSAAGNDSNTGKSDSPLATIAAAVTKMNDTEADYTILVDGTLQGHQKIAAASTYSETGAALNVSAKSITIKGINSGTLDGNGTTPLTLNVSEDVPVTIKDLIITNSNADANNVGLEIKGGNIFIEDGTHITGNNGSGMDVSGANVTMNGGKISSNMGEAYSAAGVHLMQDAVFIMNGGQITGNTNINTDSDNYSRSVGGVFQDYDCTTTFIMNGGVISGNNAGAGVSDFILSNSDSTFKIGGSASIGDMYVDYGTVILVTSPLTGSGTVATIEPSLYEEGRQIIEIEAGSGVNLAEAVSRFELKQPSDGSHWEIASDGTLTEGYETTISGLTSLLNSLAANSVESPYSVKITDSDLTNFAFANSNITNALAAVSVPKYIKLAFKNAGFSTISGNAALSPYITNLTIPSSVSGITFIDLGPNFTGFTVAEGNTTFTASDGILYQNSGRKIVRYPAAYPETTATIASNITAIADGAFAGCTNIASFSVASGNTYFKVVSGEWATNTSTYSAYQLVKYWQKDTTIPDAPGEWGTDEYNTWETQNTLKISKQNKTEYVPVPVLTSYDGKTLYACPPAVTFETQASLMTKAGYVEGTTDQLENTITASNYVASTPTFNFETVRPYAFSNVAGLTGATITDPRTSGSTFTELVAYTFKDCVSLTSVTLGASIEIVKANALAGCTALTEIGLKAYNSQTTSTTTLASYVESGAYPSTCTVTLKAIGTSN